MKKTIVAFIGGLLLIVPMSLYASGLSDFATSFTQSINSFFEKFRDIGSRIIPSSNLAQVVGSPSLSLVVSLSVTPQSQNVVAGGTSILFANVQLDASKSSHDMTISQIKLRHSGSGSESNLSSCQVYSGAVVLNTGSNVPTTIADGTATTFTFDYNFVISRIKVMTLSLKCNLAGGATGTYQFDLNASDTIIATPIIPKIAINPITTSGGTMTVNSGSLAVTLDSSSPEYKAATNGSTNVPVAVLRFVAKNEAIKLEKIALQLSPTNPPFPNSSSDVTQVTLWDGATQVGTAVFTGYVRYATSTLTRIVNIPKDSFKLITVRVDLPTLNSQAGIGSNPKPGALVKVDYDGGDSNGTQGTGVDSGTTLSSSSSDTASAGIRVYRSYPIFTYSTTGATLTNGSIELLSLKVQANSSGDVQLRKLSFSIATTTVKVISSSVNGPSGSVGTAVITGQSSINKGILRVTFNNVANINDRTIAAGETKTYSVRGTITGLTGSNAGSVSIALKGDISHPVLSNTPVIKLMGNINDSGIAASRNVWSPNSTTTSATTNNDWTNSYGLPGCFSTSGLGKDCAPRVLSI